MRHSQRTDRDSACLVALPTLWTRFFSTEQAIDDVLPSSIHELILVPDNGDMNKNYMMQMVREVNSTEVRPDEI